MAEAKRRLKKIDVSFISLVDKGANGKQIIFKSANSPSPNISKVITIIKTDEEKRLVYGTVYEPETTDSQLDIADETVIEKAAHDFLAKLNNKNVDVQHDFNPDDGAVVESFILRAADPMFPDTKINSWVVAIKIANDDTWALIKSGEISGLSLAGLAVVEEIQKNQNTESQDSLISRITKAVKEVFIPTKKDFNSQWSATQLNQMFWALQDSLREVMYDEKVTDKKAAILANIDQFRAAAEATEIQTLEKNAAAVSKAGKVFNSKNLKSLKQMRATMDEMILQMESDEEEVKKNIHKNNLGDSEMKPEEIQAIVKTAVEEALKPVTESIEKMKTEVNEKAGGIEKRLDKVEKASPGSAQDIQVEGVEKKDTTYKGVGWLS